MFLKAFQHFTGETHWFPSSSQGIQVPDELVPFVKLHIQQYGWSESIVELKDTGNYATSKGYESLGSFIETYDQTLAAFEQTKDNYSQASEQLAD